MQLKTTMSIAHCAIDIVVTYLVTYFNKELKCSFAVGKAGENLKVTLL